MAEYGLNREVFTCIGRHESGWNAHAMNQNGRNMVIGIYQEGDDNGFSAKSLCDPHVATKAAK